MPQFGGTASFSYPYGVVFDCVVQALGDLRWGIKQMDPTSGHILASISLTPLSWGEDVHIQVAESPPGQTWVSLNSASKFAIFDWGKNRKNVDRFFARVHDLLARSGYTASVAQPAPAVPQEQPGGSTCQGCASPLPSGANFCTTCGKRIVIPGETEPLVESVAPPKTFECPACGTANRAGAKYCAGCGQAIHPKFF